MKEAKKREFMHREKLGKKESQMFWPQPVTCLWTILVRSPYGRWAPVMGNASKRVICLHVLESEARLSVCGEENMGLESERPGGQLCPLSYNEDRRAYIEGPL